MNLNTTSHQDKAFIINKSLNPYTVVIHLTAILIRYFNLINALRTSIL